MARKNRNNRINRAEALVNVTWQGQNGDMFDPVPLDASDRDIRDWVCEAIRSGSVSGVNTRGYVDLKGFVVDRFPATAHVPYARIFVRPKTPFG